MRKRVYIAGPITRGVLADNLNQATAAFVALAKAGLAPHCPHWSAWSGTAHPAGGHPSHAVAYASAQPNELAHADWMAVDLCWVAVADCVLRLPGESAGADIETAEAARLGIPVFHSIGDVTAWAGA